MSVASRAWLLLGVVCLTLGCRAVSAPPSIAKVPEFSLHDQHDQQITAQSLRGKVWVANFIFTNCPDVCPLLTGKLSGVRTELLRERSKVHFVSFSVDPANDTPAVLQKYANEHNADHPNWSFLTGPVDAIKAVVIQGFKQSMDPKGEEPGKAYTVLHGSHFVLVDRALMIRGYYPSDQEGLMRLARDARLLLAEKAAAGP